MTVQEENVAVHLVRNSLGGNDHELIAGADLSSVHPLRGVYEMI